MNRATALLLFLLLIGWLPAVASQPLLLPPDFADWTAVPFEEGEEVVYSVHWKPLFLFPAFKAGELRLRIDRSRYQDQPVFKISAWASSDGLLKSVAGLDVQDYFESTVDDQAFRSLRFLHQTRQNRRKRDLEVINDYPRRRSQVREIDLASDPPRRLRDEEITGLDGRVLDSLSVFYAARLRPLDLDRHYQLQLSDNGRVQQVDLQVVKREKIRIDLGTYPTLKVETKNGIFKGGGDFTIWYSRDARRIPVKFEAKVKYGRVFGELISLSTPSFSTSRVRVP